jgi:macrolide transport system ATP-binding/permease protein
MLLQFLAEAIVLSVSGGLAGSVAGIAFSAAIALVFHGVAPVSMMAIAGGLSVCRRRGHFFGYEAAQVAPINALRCK